MYGLGCLLGCFAKITEDTLNRFFGRVQFLFNFATEKFVVIKDWRLGLVLRLLQVAILIYVLSDILKKASYMIQEVPKGVISPSAEVTFKGRRRNLRAQRDNFTDDNLNYCNDGAANYDYNYREVEYKDFQCVVMDPLSNPQVGETKFFVTTYLRLDKLYFLDMPNRTNGCPGPRRIDSVRDDAETIGNFFDVCLYNTVDQYFAIQPEEIPLTFVHSYYTSVVDKTGAIPQTVIKAEDFDGGEVWTDNGQPIRITVSDLLKVSGVDLDKPLDQQPNDRGLEPSARDNETVPYPFARLSGVTLIMTFKYYTRALAPGRFNEVTGKTSRNTLCVVDVSPQYTWSSQGSDVEQRVVEADDPFFINPARTRLDPSGDPVLEGIQVDFQRNGIQLRFQISGNMGEFDFFALVNALVAGAVLLSVAQLIVTYIALYALGLSSLLYAEYMRESVNWRKEYARFAAQSLVAGSTFMQYDTNKSEVLDRKEIYTYLSEIFGGDREDARVLTDAQVACLADFLMRHGEMDANVSKGQLEDVSDVKVSTINMAEWVDIFTEEKVQIRSLARLVDSEYSDPQIIRILVALAEGRGLRELTGLQRADISRLEREETRPEDRLLDESEGVRSEPEDVTVPKEGSSERRPGEAP